MFSNSGSNSGSNDCEIKDHEGTHIPVEKGDPREIVHKRLERAWSRITTPEFAQRSQEFSIENGEGIGVYRFLIPSVSGEDKKKNCEYYYADKGCPLWDAIVSGLPDKTQFEKTYQSSSMYAVCVCVPVSAEVEETMQTLRLFKYDSHQEIEF